MLSSAAVESGADTLVPCVAERGVDNETFEVVAVLVASAG